MMDKLDVLNRDQFVDQLVSLTENISANRKTVSFALDGAWGSGKSFVLDMFEERLGAIQAEEKVHEKFFIIRYNCWKYDYYSEPLVAIVSSVIDIINQKTEIWPDSDKKATVIAVLKGIGNTLFSIANSGIKEKTGIDVKESFDTIKAGVNDKEKQIDRVHKYDDFYAVKKALKSLQKLLGEISQDYTVVFLVDELDRCIPEYSVKVLERLHHLTEDADNVITILSIDKTQLQNSIRQIFGFDHPEKYLEKFIDFEIKLDFGTISEKITEKYAEYISLFDKGAFKFNDSIEEFLQALFTNIDVRLQEKIVERTRIAHNLLYKDRKDYVFMCMELLLAVLICAYDNDLPSFNEPVPLGDGEHAYDRIFCKSSRGNPPAFSSFFAEKCSDLSIRYEHLFPEDRIGYVLPSSVSLYGALLFVWYWMHPSNKRITFKHNRGDVYSPIENYHKELKKFVDTILVLK